MTRPCETAQLEFGKSSVLLAVTVITGFKHTSKRETSRVHAVCKEGFPGVVALEFSSVKALLRALFWTPKALCGLACEKRRFQGLLTPLGKTAVHINTRQKGED